MKQINIIQAWKDEEYRSQLTQDELARIPANPAGLIELEEGQLRGVTGGANQPDATAGFLSTGCCGGFTASTYCFCTWGYCSSSCSYSCVGSYCCSSPPLCY